MEMETVRQYDQDRCLLRFNNGYVVEAAVLICRDEHGNPDVDERRITLVDPCDGQPNMRVVVEATVSRSKIRHVGIALIGTRILSMRVGVSARQSPKSICTKTPR